MIVNIMKKKLIIFFIICGVIIFFYKFFYFNNNSKYINFSNNKNCIKSLNKEIKPTSNPDYSFFVAGHVYGSPYANNPGIYPKFYKKLLDDRIKFEFGIFAGDITKEGDRESWIVFDSQIRNLDYQIFIAPGNHDIGSTRLNKKRVEFKKKFGKLYQSFIFKNDLFIILNPYDNQWSIKGPQLEFLEKKLKKNYQLVDNIFIITHPVIYFNDNFNIKMNNFDGAGDNTNFWNEIYVLFKKYKNNYYVVAGDVGAFANGFELFCEKFEETVFLATGMGGGERDNYLIFRKFKNKIFIVPEVF